MEVARPPRLVVRLAKGRAAEKVQHRTDIDVQNDIERKAKLEAAQKQRDENNDGIKALLTLGARASAFTLRQNQLRDKEERMKEEAEYDRRMDIVMEVDRLRDLQARERVEAIKQNRFWILTHDTTHVSAQARFRDLKNGSNPSDPYEALSEDPEVSEFFRSDS